MGNFESKLSTDYSIIDESCKISNEISTEPSSHLHQSLWVVKKVKFNTENKQAILYEFANGKFGSLDEKKKKFQLALTQIKVYFVFNYPL